MRTKTIHALIDGDPPVYACGFAAENKVYTVYYEDADGEMRDVEFENAKQAKEFVAENGGELIPTTRVQPLGFAIKNAMTLLDKIKEATGATSYEIFLTGKSNFRDELVDYYKANRDPTHKPVHYKDIKEWLINKRGAVVVEGYEADDALAIAQYECIREQEEWDAKYCYLPVKGSSRDAVIDREVLSLVDGFTWRLNAYGYVVAAKDDTNYFLHRVIMGYDGEDVIDHINNNPLHNCRENLRITSHKNNIRKAKAQEGSSPFKGVSWSREKEKWNASIKYEGKSISLGRYDKEEEAAAAYDEAAIKYFGEDNSWLNFPTTISKDYERPEDTIIATIDKDLNMVPSWHYNWQKDTRYFVTQKGGLEFFYTQMLTGDSTDNIPGVFKLTGKKATAKMKEGLKDKSELEMWEYVKAQYGPDVPEEKLIEIGRLLHMTKYLKDGKAVLWNPPIVSC